MMEEADHRLLAMLEEMEVREASDLFVGEDKVPAMRIHGRIHDLDEEPTRREEIQGLVDRVVVDDQGPIETWRLGRWIDRWQPSLPPQSQSSTG